jgi:hypothetical protein
LDLVAVTQMHYVLEDVQNQQEFVGDQHLPTVVCVLKAVEEALLIVQPEHQCGAVSKLVVSAEQARLMLTAVLFVIMEAALLVVVLMRLAEM